MIVKTVESLYNKNYSKMTDNDLYIFDYVMKNVPIVSRISITDLSKELAISKSTISRFTQKIGFSGFSEFKYFLAESLNHPENDKEEKIVEIVMDDIQGTYKLFKQSDLKNIVKKLYEAPDIFCYGTGWGQKTALEDLRRNMIVLNKYTIEISASTELEMISRAANENDVLIIASLSGNVSNVEDQLNIFKSRGAIIVAITSIQASRLARIANYTIYFQTTAIPYKNDELISFLPVNQVTNMLFLEYFEYVRDLEATVNKES